MNIPRYALWIITFDGDADCEEGNNIQVLERKGRKILKDKGNEIDVMYIEDSEIGGVAKYIKL